MTILGGRHSVPYGTTTIVYELTYSERKTVAIHVYPDGSIVVNAPVGIPLKEVEQKVFKRAGWILRQNRQFAEFPPTHPLPRRYVGGESYLYLGRQYRLKVAEDAVGRVVLSRGYLTVGVQDSYDKQCIAKLIDSWYRRQAYRIFEEQLVACYPRVESLGIPYPELMIRQMKSRWGSCGVGGRITLNLKLIQVPKNLIDYVILHELCHLKEHNHSSAFYALLDHVLPDWHKRRERLNKTEIM